MCRFLIAILVLISVAALGGCGGQSGSQTATGRAVFSILWPDNTRLIPAASNSITVTIKRGSSTFSSKTISRPAGGGPASITFDTLPVDTLSATATAYPQSNGTGVAQATATVPLVTQANQTVSFSLTMASTIDHLDISPPAPSLAVGQTANLTITARDSSNNIVLTSPGKMQWLSGNDTFVTVDSNGKVTAVRPTGVNPAHVFVQATDSESGKSVSSSVSVTSTTTVQVTPTPVTMPYGDPKQFFSTVNNAPDNTVAWSVQEGAAGGSITTDGIYTASQTPGTYHVVATSNYDNSKSANATVNVKAGGADVIIK